MTQILRLAVITLLVSIATTVSAQQKCTDPSHQHQQQATNTADTAQITVVKDHPVTFTRNVFSKTEILLEERFTDFAVSAYYKDMYGFDVYEKFPDYPRWPKGVDVGPDEYTQFRLAESDWINVHPEFSKLLAEIDQRMTVPARGN